jgi:hypothetical protein
MKKTDKNRYNTKVNMLASRLRSTRELMKKSLKQTHQGNMTETLNRSRSFNIHAGPRAVELRRKTGQR